MSELREWKDEGVAYPATLRVIPYEDASERSVMFRVKPDPSGYTMPVPALRKHQVRELVGWLTSWLDENADWNGDGE